MSHDTPEGPHEPATHISSFVRRQADGMARTLADGLQPGDLLALVRTVAEAVDLASELDTVDARREAARQLFGLVLEETDTPWLPDAWTDPAMAAGFELILPRLIPDHGAKQ